MLPANGTFAHQNACQGPVDRHWVTGWKASRLETRDPRSGVKMPKTIEAKAIEPPQPE
jgi:hypothetical protein